MELHLQFLEDIAKIKAGINKWGYTMMEELN